MSSPTDRLMDPEEEQLTGLKSADCPGKVDLRGRPVDKLKTGCWKGAVYVYVIHYADFLAAFSVLVNLVPYITSVMHQPVEKAARISNFFAGACSLLAVLAGFVADSYLGCFRTIVIGNVSTILGLSLLTFSASYSRLQPPACVGGQDNQCEPAGSRYMVPLYIAIYTIAFGTGFVKPTSASLGAEQFDENDPVEKKKGVHFFVWYFFTSNLALMSAYTLGVYLQDHVSRGWGYGFALIVYVICCVVFYLGTPFLRHRRPVGSFLTRIAQVLVASVRKRKVAVAREFAEEVDNSPLPGNLKLKRTNQLSFLDKASVIIDKENANDATRGVNRWRLCGVSQVEETKRILQFIPVWLPTWMVSIVFAQTVTYTVQQAKTLDRKISAHFEIPAATVIGLNDVVTISLIPIYTKLLIPFVKKITKHPHGFKTLQRLGAAIVFAVIAMICGAFAERKRLTVVRELHLEHLPLGSFSLPLKFYWLFPQLVALALVEFFFFVTLHQFFFHESAGGTRTIGTSFIYMATAMGKFISTVIASLVDRSTRHEEGGSWLKGNLNNGGLEKFYWLLAVLLAVDFVIYLAVSHMYQYKYDWYDLDHDALAAPTSTPGRHQVQHETKFEDENLPFLEGEL